MKVTRLGFLILVATVLLSVLFVLVENRTGNMRAANAQTPSYLSKTGSTLDFLLTLAERKVQPRLASELGEKVASMVETQSLSVSINFDHELSEAEIAGLEAQGFIFVRVNGEVAHSGTIYGAKMPIGSVDALKERTDVLRIESVWQPGVEDPLDVSVPEINADDMWQFLDAGGNNITGEGITVADFNSGIDVFHPDFWKADGGSYAWIDTNTNGTFDPGIDAVDLDGDGVADGDETLEFFDAQGPAGNNDGVFQVDMDWLYNDADSNWQRDYGTVSGFAETDPTYGELLFTVDDMNSNNALDVGENLVALGTSKVFRTLNTGGTQRIRGTDLILTDADTNGHGTSVCGIVNGGVIGNRRYVGVAPSAELLVANRRENSFTLYIPWARANGADVMLYEFGGWLQQFLDGSSNLEQAIDAEAALGVVQVVPAGNLGNKDKHAQDDVTAGGSTNFTFNVPAMDNPVTPPDEDIDTVYMTALWRTTGNNLAFTITTPTPSVANLPAAPGDTNWHSTTTGDGHTIWYRREDSTRGTAKYDITIDRNDVITGGWTVQVTNNSGANEHVDMYIGDDQTSWTGGALWTAFQSNDNTVTWPATADSAITVASYSTRGVVVPAGDLSTFSPAGPRIDGQPVVDIAAPGNYDIASAQSKDASGGTLGSYRWFSGTSAAGPHVAAASALLLQWDPTLNHGQIKTMLQQGARTDVFTGATPNVEWGHGKLDVLAIVNQPPVCDANGPYMAECQGVTTAVPLDGTGSSDPNPGDPLSYSWTTDCPNGSFDDPTSPTPTLTMDTSPGCSVVCSITLTVTDSAGASDSCSTTVTVQDTIPPIITCPADTTMECDQSTDPENTGFATVTDECDPAPVIDFSDAIISGACPEVFVIRRTWTATDACGNVSSCVQTIEAMDTTPPEIAELSVGSDNLWPPNHKMVDVGLTYSVSDACDQDPIILTQVTSDEPTATAPGAGGARHSSDAEITGDGRVLLRAERSGKGDGRVYVITLTATDECGNSASSGVSVKASHNKKKGAVDSGQNYDATQIN